MRAAAAEGKLTYEIVGGATTATYVFATYPLKFLHPRASIRAQFDTIVTYMLGYGGGLVGGDTVTIDVVLHPDTKVVLCTQATTKVFRSISTLSASQTYDLTIQANATLAFLPDPVTCFRQSKYKQRQTFRLDKNANLVLVDWASSGRQRTYSLHDFQREEEHESWLLDEYESWNEIFLDGQKLLHDRVILRDEESTSLRSRMVGMHVFGIVVLVGELFQPLASSLIASNQRKALQHANDITPQGRLDAINQQVLAACSPLGDTGCILRFCGREMEPTVNYIRKVLEPLQDLIGFVAYQENR